MKDSLFWKGAVLLVAAALFYIGAGLSRSMTPPAAPSESTLFSSTAQAAPLGKATLKWSEISTQRLSNSSSKAYRAKVPGGWLVHFVSQTYIASGGTRASISSVFIPDQNHTWDGGSLP